LLKGNYSQATNYPITKQFYPFLGMATDAAGNIWVPDFTGVTELPFGNYEMGQMSYATRGFNCEPGFGACPDAIAIDGAGNVWLAGDSTLAVAELSSANYNSTPLRYATFRGKGVDLYTSLAIDAAGNVWVTDRDSSYESELVGVAKPVMTPLQSCLAFETNNPGQACVP
jgi:streptogramin lyase